MEKKDKAVYDMQYAKENLQQVRMSLNKSKDADLLSWLERQTNKQGYIKELIRKDMEGKTMKIYESYGVLAHEKKPVFSVDIPASDAYDEIRVYIPDEVEISENAMGEKLVDIEGNTYLLSEVLTNFGDKPCLKWFDGKKERRIMLEVI